MSYGDVFTRINREYYQLTGAERKIADHIMLRRQDCQYMSISELAEEAEVAEATVSRFCRRLGWLFLTDVLSNEVCRRDMEGCRERRRLVADALADKYM